MAGFDPFANQGGPAAWDPDTPNTSRELADKLLNEVDDAPEIRPEEQPSDSADFTGDDTFFAPTFTD